MGSSAETQAAPRRLVAVARRGLTLAIGFAGLALAAPPFASPQPPTPAPAAPTVAQAHMAIDATPADMAWAAHGPRSTGAAPAAAPLPVLQGLHQPAHGGPTAMIDGRLLQVGERIGERTVIGIDHQGVTLRGPDGTARLRLPGLTGQRPPADRATSAAATDATAAEPPAAEPTQPFGTRGPGAAMGLSTGARP